MNTNPKGAPWPFPYEPIEDVIAWDEWVVGREYWQRIGALTAQEFCLLRRGCDPRKFERERDNLPDGGEYSLGELVTDDLREVEASPPKKNWSKEVRLPLADWVAWARHKKWDLPAYLQGAADSAAPATPDGAAGAQACEEWLVEIMKNGSPEAGKGKQHYRREAWQRFKVGARGFERFWNNAVARSGNPAWTKPGRRKKS